MSVTPTEPGAVARLLTSCLTRVKGVSVRCCTAWSSDRRRLADEPAVDEPAPDDVTPARMAAADEEEDAGAPPAVAAPAALAPTAVAGDTAAVATFKTMPSFDTRMQ